LKDYYTRTIRKMLIIRVFLLPFVVLLLVYGTIIYAFAAYSGRQVKNELMRIATDHRNLIDQFLSEKSAMLQFMTASLPWSVVSTKNDLNSVLKNLQNQSRAFFDLGVFDSQGRHVVYAGPFDLAGRSYAESDWFKAVQNRDVFISDSFLGFRRIPHFIIAVKKQEGPSTWYLRATIDTQYFNDLVESIRIGHTGEAYIVNRTGILQTQRRSGGRIMATDNDFPHYANEQNDSPIFFSKGGWYGGYLYAASPIAGTGWRLIVRQAISDAYGPLATAVLISFLLLIGGGAVVVVMGFFMASNMATRLKLADMEKREMKTQLILAGKLAEVGEMSTGIAHEINNPLQVMKSEVAMIQYLTQEMSSDKPSGSIETLAQLKDAADQIGIQIDRCSTITRGLLDFARKQESKPEPIALANFIPQMVQLVDHRARLENVRIVQQIESQLPPVFGDANQLQQVFLNLFNNAIYALKGRPSPEIRIAVRWDGSAIKISVADNGCGFTPEQMEKAFIPFFTTKPVGQGTGLGLSTIYGIIKAMGGDITLTSEHGSGSEFVICLPLSGVKNAKAA